jgi:hypothetical protein
VGIKTTAIFCGTSVLQKDMKFAAEWGSFSSTHSEILKRGALSCNCNSHSIWPNSADNAGRGTSGSAIEYLTTVYPLFVHVYNVKVYLKRQTIEHPITIKSGIKDILMGLHCLLNISGFFDFC